MDSNPPRQKITTSVPKKLFLRLHVQQNSPQYIFMNWWCASSLQQRTKSIKSRKARGEWGQPGEKEIHAFYTGGAIYSIVQTEPAHLSNPIARTHCCVTLGRTWSLLCTLQTKHRKNFECCPQFIVFKCQNCNQCLKCNKSLVLSLSLWSSQDSSSQERSSQDWSSQDKSGQDMSIQDMSSYIK